VTAVRLDASGPLARLVLARPERHNAIDLTMARELQAALAECATSPGVRALLIGAEGPAFCVGGDLGHVGGDPDALRDIARDMVEAVQDVVARVAELPVPVVCAAGGAVAGVGLGLLWASDIVVAGDDLRLATAFADVGVSGDGGSSWWLPRLVGLRRAQELMLLNRRLDAREADDWGLVTRVVPAVELAEEAERTAGELASGATVALGRMRALLRDGVSAGLREHLAAEADGVLACADSADMREALRAFGERRRPRFVGG
jgi:2-(1,2-epoxy-1,2-dihydrophenyl)acetyl-CoA isomerase